MFEKFGEFDSYEEINRAAKAQLEEGDLEAIKTIAEENGLDPEDAEDFCTGAIEELTTPSLAAMGKLELEAKDLSLTGALRDWTDFIEQLCLEDEEMAFAVRRKGKSLKDCMALILKNAFNDKAQLDDRITKAAGLTPPLYISIAKKQEVRAILFEDLDPDSPTFGAMCLGTLGFEIAGERTADGRDWKWSTFGTGKGFYADFIVAGTMLADRIKGGTLELGGEDNGNGIARVMDATGKEIVRLDKGGVYAIGSYVCENVGGLNRRTEIKSGSIMFSKRDKSNPIFIERSGDAIVVRYGGTFEDATDSHTLMRIFSDAIYFDTDKIGPGGVAGKTGRAVFSDGTYMDFENGFLMGGTTKEGEI